VAIFKATSQWFERPGSKRPASLFVPTELLIPLDST
jgi:hypothetical protein